MVQAGEQLGTPTEGTINVNRSERYGWFWSLFFALIGLALVAPGLTFPGWAQTQPQAESMTSNLQVQVQSTDPDWEGRTVEISVLVHAMGMEQGPRTVVDPVSVDVGQTEQLGEISFSPGQSVDLVVTTDQGTFLQPVAPSELEQEVVVVGVGEETGSENLSVETHFTILQPFPARVMVREMILLRNESDGPVPAGEVGFEMLGSTERVRPGQGFRDESDFTVEEDRLTYRLQVGPGITVLEWFYMIPAEDVQNLERTLTYPTAELQVQVPPVEGVEVEFENLSRTESDRQGTMLTSQNLQPGDRYSVTLSGLSEMELPGMGSGNEQPPGGSARQPGPPEPGTQAPDEPWHPGGQSEPATTGRWPMLLSILFSLLVFAGSYAYVRYHLNRSSNAVEADFVIEEIARLDRAAEEGLIPEEFHQRTRERWKSSVREPDSSTD